MRTLRLVDIAELLGVSKQRAPKIAEESVPGPGRGGRPRTVVGSAGGHGVGEALAPREALALAVVAPASATERFSTTRIHS